MSLAAGDDLVIVFRGSRAASAEFALVLEAKAIPYQSIVIEANWALAVTPELAEQARGAGADVVAGPGGAGGKGEAMAAALEASIGDIVVFLDADVVLEDTHFIEETIAEMRARGLHCATTDIHCPQGSWKSRLAYGISNFYQRGSRFFGTPFATGMCMFFDRKVFEALGGFREDALFAEDYLLSKQVGWRRFRVLPGGVATSDRRMRKMGYWRLARLFLTTALLSHRQGQFTKDHGYWNH